MRLNVFIKLLSVFFSFFLSLNVTAQIKQGEFLQFNSYSLGEILLLSLLIITILSVSIFVVIKSKQATKLINFKNEKITDLNQIINNLNSNEVEALMKNKNYKPQADKNSGSQKNLLQILLFFGISILSSSELFAQTAERKSLMSEGGIIITVILILTPILVGLLLIALRILKLIRRYRHNLNIVEARKMTEWLKSLPQDQVTEALIKRKAMLDFKVSSSALSGTETPNNEKGIIGNINEHTNIRFIEEKRKAIDRPGVDPKLSKLVIWFLISATVWLVFGTTVGEYVGIKFVAPDADSLSWLSFGRLRPVHTNAVFWGWSSMAMIGLGYYVVPRVGNNEIYNLKWGWWTLWLINISVFVGSISLMAGINNAGGEYREYIWPIQLLFAIGIILTLMNFIRTIARRNTKEIYVSNWYIVAALMFVVVITLAAYLPFWQDGLGETIIQGYYMHQGVGMWFMMFVLGLVYYFLPQQLNKPIYSYSLGILAFWSQIFFYTVIGTHHFVFSSIPWALQTVAIVGSVGMIIPVVSGTTNFIMTFKGAWHKLSGSYTLPFFLIGIIFYFTGSMQGTAEAFRTTNLYWHFTDFTTAHSHITMYGIIAFFLWAFIYAIIPRITRQEPPQLTVGMHFWMAFIGLLFYSIPLMIGGTMRGIMWMDGKPFIDSVTAMAPFWLWRAIGGTLMWASHLIFAYNMYKMIYPRQVDNINEEVVKNLTSEDSESIAIH
ncbi:MAG: cbb3-type cytochrome c oxidase subunit I [Ferruginibacter sp.]